MSGPTRKLHPRFGALFCVTLLLAGSGLVRLATEAGPILVRQAVAAGAEDANDPPSAETAPAKPLDEVLRALQEREDALDLRERQVEDRMNALAIADKAVEEKLMALRNAERELSATLALADGASEADLDRLTSVYEKMKPRDSAAVFEAMDPAFAAGFLARMRPEAAAGIMALLSPQAAYTVSVILAGRNASVPTE